MANHIRNCIVCENDGAIYALQRRGDRQYITRPMVCGACLDKLTKGLILDIRYDVKSLARRKLEKIPENCVVVYRNHKAMRAWEGEYYDDGVT